MPLNEQGRSEVIAFSGMIIDDVQNDLDAGLVETRHHFLELGEGEVGNMGVAPGPGRKNAMVL